MSEREPDPIIIKKRRDDHEEEHHGGVWKLAFADFMTAMMAFFLVMWLINSTSKETKASIVQYFNPIQIVDSSPAHKGVRDPKTGGQGKGDQRTRDENDAAASALERERQDVAIHTQPIKTLDDIAARNLPAEPQEKTRGADARLAIHDPFDRVEQSDNAIGEPDRGSALKDLPRGIENGLKMQTSPEPKTAIEGQRSSQSVPPVAIEDALEKIVRSEAMGGKGAPHVEVAQTEEGLLISLIDDANFSMFGIGSIEPKPQLVRVLAQVGRLLAARKGNVEVRGHTDARSYKTAAYDNWRLSTDRANVVHYMLMRGNLAETRISRIVGYADRSLKAPKDPLAPINRRIEILLHGEGK